MDDNATELGAILAELRRLNANLNAAPTRVAFGGAGVQETLDNWPVIGHKRLIAVNRGVGGIITLANGIYTDLLPQSAGRGGLSIVCAADGGAGVYVFGARAGDAQRNPTGTPAGWMEAGGDWDGTIGDEAWCGHVSLMAPDGATIVWWSL